MRKARLWALTGAAGLAISCTVAAAWPASGAPTPNRSSLSGSLTPAVERSHPAGSMAASSAVSFDLLLTLRDAAGAQAVVKQVSDPGSAEFHHYLSLKTWVSRYAPSTASVTKAEAWLRGEGLTVGALPKDRLFVPATGSAADVEKAFGVTLGYYKVNGHTVRLANGTLSIPSALNGVVSGAVGVNQYMESTDLSQGGSPSVPSASSLASASLASAAKPAQEPPPPAAFVNPTPCSSYWGASIDTKDSGSLYAPYKHPLPYDICGYAPDQLRGAYNLAGTVAAGDDGSGVGIAIVDAYDSPTLLSDAQEYFKLNDPAHPLSSAQFFNDEPATVDDQSECLGSGWYDEQALDVESSHTMAPGADILFVGAQDCFDNSLLTALTTAVTSGASVVSDSWADPTGDLLDDAATKTAFDDTFMLADTTGVSVLFSTGDDGDNFADFGLAAPDYPPSSPFVTAVGGTTLEVNKNNQRAAEYGWSTAKQELCTGTATNCGTATKPAGSLAWQAGGGGGTSYYYTQPYYQAPVVPSDLALRNQALFGDVPLRVIPDISMDADAQSGMLIGLTEAFPNGNHYGQFKEGGTSLASPLLAGVIADADQKAGVSLGFLNPVLYKAYSVKGTFNDILPPSNPDATAVIRVDYANTVDNSAGYIVSLRAIDYGGPETYCDGTGNCATRLVTLSTAAGFDSLTGLGSAGPDFVANLSKF
jgi:subtilase family serine protease